MPFPQDAYDKSGPIDARAIADTLYLWRFCGRAACLRSHSCRGNSDDCVPRCSPLAPEEARGFIIGLLDAREEGLSYDEAFDTLLNEEAALHEWEDAVLRSLIPVAEPIADIRDILL